MVRPKVPKKKKERKPPNLQPQYTLSKEEIARREAPNKKKQKRAPDALQPRWLHPPDEENPVLNPKVKTEEQLKKEKEEHDDSINFLKHKVVGAPMKAPPPGLLITLVGAFLTSYGLDSASRLYTSQIQARKRLDDWKVELGHKLPKGHPSLLMIFKEFEKKWNEEHEDDTSSSESEEGSESESEEQPKPSKAKGKAKKKSKNDSSSDSDSSSDDDSDEGKKSTDVTSASNSSESDSENETKAVASTPAITNATAEDSDSSSSDSEDQDVTLTAATLVQNPKPPNSDSSVTLEIPTASKSQMSASVSSSSTSDDSSSDDSDAPAQTAGGAMIPPPALLSYQDETSAVPGADNANDKKRKASDSLEEAPDASRQKTAGSQRWQRVPTDTKVDPRFSSNKYQSYDYAEKAHQDLVVTKGRGFTKEKNKKKRGSYRGGQIDVSGGKGIRFD